MIHRSEFQVADIMKYVKEIGELDPKVKGRYSNQTFIDFPSIDGVAVTLDIKWVQKICRFADFIVTIPFPSQYLLDIVGPHHAQKTKASVPILHLPESPDVNKIIWNGKLEIWNISTNSTTLQKEGRGPYEVK